MASRELVREFLLSPIKQYDGCFVSHPQFEEIKLLGDSVMPEIENILLNEVLPRYSLTESELCEQFPGLEVLLICYFQLSNPNELERALKFFAKLKGALLTLSLGAMRTWVVGIDEQPLPCPFVEPLSYLSKQGTVLQVEYATFLVEKHTRFVNLIKSGRTPRNTVAFDPNGPLQVLRGRPVRSKRNN
jgi:hypothetical protein